jgi:dipeptidyl aminopeptidase/acylaminoacyl peptidase
VLAYPDNNRLAWAADERRVLVTNTFLPLDEQDGSDFSERDVPCAVASVDLPSFTARCLFFEDSKQRPDGTHVQDISFGANNNEAVVLVKHGLQERVVLRYRLQNGEWGLTSSRPLSQASNALAESDRKNGSHSGLQISVRQSLNDPPTLWVSDAETGQTRQLWNPNPQLSHVRFGDASIYHWKDQTGYEWTGVLVKPVDYVPGKRYPLVEQMYSFVRDQFLTDGLYPTAFAARHLASAGFVVLQIERRPSTLTEADAQNSLDGYRSAVESLSRAGLIDRSRVGVVGFSWTCWYTVNALIKEPKLFAAATIADGVDNSYMQYMLFAVENFPLQQQMERIRGASPFGDGLKRWIEEAPEFHLDQVQAPVRIEAMNPGSVLQEWELYSALRMQNRPVDFIYFPHGTHIHQRPLERLESQQGNVDWFRFWLEGYEDSDPSKHAQYERWQMLKKTLRHEPTIGMNR